MNPVALKPVLVGQRGTIGKLALHILGHIQLIHRIARDATRISKLLEQIDHILGNTYVLTVSERPRSAEVSYPDELKTNSRTLVLPNLALAAPTRTPTAHATVAAPVPRHDRAADRATGSVAHVDQLFQCVGCVVVSGERSAHREVVSCHLSVVSNIRTAFREVSKRLLTMSVLVRCGDGSYAAHVLGTQAVEQRLLLSGEEAQQQPAEDVVHVRLGIADVGIVAPATGLEAGVRELLAQQLQGHAVLQRDRSRAGKAVHQAADGRAFLGHGDEQLAGHAVFVESHSEVALVSAHLELVGDGEALVRQTVTDCPRRSGGLVFGLFSPTLWDSHRRS